MLWQWWNQQTCCWCCFGNHQRIFAVIVLYSLLCNLQCTAMTYLPLQHSLHCYVNITVNIPCLVEHVCQLSPRRYICTFTSDYVVCLWSSKHHGRHQSSMTHLAANNSPLQEWSCFVVWLSHHLVQGPQHHDQKTAVLPHLQVWPLFPVTTHRGSIYCNKHSGIIRMRQAGQHVEQHWVSGQ